MKVFVDMNILIFSPVRVYPADAGSRIRIYNVTKHLKKMGHMVHFVYYAFHGINEKHFEHMQELCDSFSVIKPTKKVKPKEGNYKLDEFYEDTIEKKVTEICDIFKIDTVLVNYIFYSKFLEKLSDNIFKIIDTHDKFSDRYKLFLNQTDVKYTWHSYSKEDEAKALNRSDLILSITDEEKNYFSTICRKRVETIGHIEDKKYLEYSSKSLKRLGFIGGGNQVNIVAINSFLEKFLENNENDLEIVIAGNICKFIEFKNEKIKLLGLVEKLSDFYKSIDLVINPLTFGTGQKIKSIEAISYGVPIISTKVGFEGIKTKENMHLFENLDDMIEGIKEIKKMPKSLQVLAEKSREIFDSYCFEIDKKFEKVFYNNKTLEVDKNREKEFLYKNQKEIDNLLIEEYKNRLKVSNKKIKRYEKIYKKVADITKVSFFKNPIIKYKLYKRIVQEYHDKD